MASNVSDILSNIKTVVATATGINQVESWPNDIEQYLAVARITEDRLPLVHVACVGSQTVAEYTSCGIQESLTVRLTVFFSYSSDNFAQAITLRDAINAKMITCSNIHQGGYADNTTWVNWEMLTQDQDIQGFRMDYNIEHSYCRD